VTEGESTRATSDRFELRGELGSGGMGVVYRVFDRQRGGEVALKVLKARSGVDLFRFKREFRTLADVRHPNLVELHELFAVLDEWMFTMALVAGTPFNAWVRPRGPQGGFDDARLRDGLGQIAEGLAALHGVGLIHRDIKPSNILVEAGGRVVVLDFGLVAQVEELTATPTHDNLAIGTPVYMSPEQAADTPLTSASDLYSLGVMLYEGLTGRRPFDGQRSIMMGRKQTEDPTPPGRLAEVPADLELLCMALLARDPAVRPDAAGVLAALGRTPSAETQRFMTRRRTVLQPAHARALEQLWQAVADSRDHFVMVHLSGPRGSGKTEVLEAFRDALIAADVLVLHGRATGREAIEFRGLDEMMDQLTAFLVGQPADFTARVMPGNIAALTRLFPVMQRVSAARRPLLPGAGPLDADDLRRQAMKALYDLLSRISEEQPLVTLTDDAQWTTPEAIEMAAQFDRPDAPCCLHVVSHAAEDKDTLASQHMARWRGDLRHIVLPAAALESR
jgi:eukaryotic-like serine/threonine-protein kinase